MSKIHRKRTRDDLIEECAIAALGCWTYYTKPLNKKEREALVENLKQVLSESLPKNGMIRGHDQKLHRM